MQESPASVADELPPGLDETDREQIENHGSSIEEIARQLALLRQEPTAIQLARPCTREDGIVVLEASQHTALQDRFHRAAAAGRCGKFVPASGAATRMFRRLIAIRQAPVGSTAEQDVESAQRFLTELPRFAFFQQLQETLAARSTPWQTLTPKRDLVSILSTLLDEATEDLPALGFATIPKALVPFHEYGGEARTPLAEHVEEAAQHLRSTEGVCVVHFTIPQHRELEFRRAFRAIASRLEASLGGRYELSCSIQRPFTDTVALETDGPRAGNPVRTEDGRLLFRPGGHGALLPNLADLAIDSKVDIAFLRTIDNVLPEARRRQVLLWNRLLGGYLLELEDEIIEHLDALERAERAGSLGEAQVDAGLHFVASKLHLSHALDQQQHPLPVKHAWLVDRLDRPLRVCAMVPNTGQPGGGPFWVRHPDGTETPQIVEQAQIESSDPRQAEILASSTHFSPAHMVCRLRSHRDTPYDLDRFVDSTAVFSSTKSHQGRPIRVLERPGLWNGGMAFWNTVFVEVPNEIFAPVKTVFDLLSPAHQPDEEGPNACKPQR